MLFVITAIASNGTYLRPGYSFDNEDRPCDRAWKISCCMLRECKKDVQCEEKQYDYNQQINTTKLTNQEGLYLVGFEASVFYRGTDFTKVM